MVCRGRRHTLPDGAGGEAVSDYDIGPALTALFVMGVVAGGVVIAIILWLARHLDITVRWV